MVSTHSGRKSISAEQNPATTLAGPLGLADQEQEIERRIQERLDREFEERVEASVKKREEASRVALQKEQEELDRRQKELEKREAEIAAFRGPSHLMYSLSNELLTRIASFLEPSDLCRLALTCHLLHANVSPVLYRTITIKRAVPLGLFIARHASAEDSLIRYSTRTFELSLNLSLFSQINSENENVQNILQKNVEIVSALEKLRTLVIRPLSLGCKDPRAQHFLNRFPNSVKLPLPSKLAASLTNCTILWKDSSSRLWNIHSALPLFLHPSMKVLTLHDAIDNTQPMFRKSYKPTNLEELNLIDCFLSPEGLHQALCFPRALKKLTLASDVAPSKVVMPSELNPGEYFNAISRTRAAKSLQCLRVDMNYWRRILVPTPGMHMLTGVRLLEIAHRHLGIDTANKFKYNPSNFPSPTVDFDVKTLLPPNLEVLKLSPSAVDVAELYEVLLRRKELVPKLRRVVFSSLFRTKRQGKNLAVRVIKNTRIKHGLRLQKVQEQFPDVKAQRLRRLRAACDQAGVDLQILYEDPARWDIFDVGCGPALWEIPEQIC